MDDYLFSITKNLPDFKTRHGLLSENMLGVFEELKDSRIKHQACQFLRRSLNNAISRIQDSISSVEVETTELQNDDSEQKDTVDILKAKVVKTRKLLNDSQLVEDASRIRRNYFQPHG